MTARRKLAIVGLGKMGRAIEQLAPERGWEVVARIGGDANRNGVGITHAALAGAEVIVEFTAPRAAAANVRAAVEAGCPIVVGTTGWQDQLPAMSEWVAEHRGAMLTAANFSVGVNIFAEIVALAARLLGQIGGFDAHLIETHHAAKKDAPSGTAMTLRDAAAPMWPAGIPITSVRTGYVPGTHELVFDAPFETVRLAHVARDRRVFAEGALTAAAWLIGRVGVFTMRDMLGTRGAAGES
jgi:4-hydroxy-tetrahydrodipicolinate reductase